MMIKALLVVLAVAYFYAEVTSAQSCSTLTCPNPAQTFSTSPGFCRAIGISPSPPASSGCTTLSNNVSVATTSFTYNLGVSYLLWTGYIGTASSSTVVCSITVLDGISPTLSNTCPTSSSSFTASTGQCFYNTASAFNSSAVDNCPGTVSYYYSLSFTGSTGGSATGSGATFSYNFPVGTTSIYQYGKDTSGNVAGCTYSYKVTDTQAPTLSCGGSVTIGTNNACGNTLSLAPSSFTDNCATASLNPTVTTSFYGVGTGSLTFTGTDTSGNSATCAVNYHVFDTTPPVVTCPTTSTTSTSTCGYVPSGALTGASASDNCGVTSSGYSGLNAYFNGGSQFVTFSATDTAGNTNSCQQPIFVNITASPSFTTCVSQINVTAASGKCTASATYSLGFSTTASCTSSGTTFSIGSSAGTVSTTTGVFPVGVSTVSVTGIQKLSSGNNLTATCNFVVYVTDTTTPSISCSSSTASLNSFCGYFANYSYTYSNPCNDLIVSQVSGLTNGFSGVLSTTTSAPSYTVSGVFDLTSPYNTISSTCSSSITFTDTTSPVPNCPVGNYQVNLTSSCTASPTAAVSANPPTAVDNCTPASYFSSPTYTPSLGATLSGTLSSTFSVKFTDPSGNTASCSFLVTPVDVTAPTFTTCPSGQTLSATTTSCTASIPSYSISTNDNCGTVSLSYAGYIPGTVVNQPGSFSTTVTATDPSGNSNSNCVITTAFVDSVNPVFTNCNSSTIQLCPGNSIAAPTATDNCGSVIVAVSSTSGSNTTYSATDSSGNVAYCTQNVAVIDNTPPVIVCQSSFSVTIGPNLWTAGVSATNLYTSVSDNCAFISSVVASKSTFNYVDALLSPETITVSATDPSGNIGNCTLPVTVTAQPVLILPGSGSIVRQSTAFTVSWSSIPSLPSGATMKLTYSSSTVTGLPSPTTVSYSALSTSITLTSAATATSTITISATVTASVNGSNKSLAAGSQTLQYRTKL